MTFLNDGPVEFSIPELNWNFTLGFDGKDNAGKYIIHLNDILVEKLEVAEGFQRTIPPLSKSEVLTLESDSHKSMTYQPFVVGYKTPITFEQDLRAKVVTIYAKNKMIKQWNDVNKPGDWQQPFFYSEGDLKMEFRWNYDTDQPVLFLDGKEHDTLPFLSPDFKLDEQELDLYQADLFMDKKQVTTEYETFEWEPHVFLHKIHKNFGIAAAKKILILYLSHPTTVTNELIDFLANHGPATGYEELHFNKFYNCMNEPMAPPIMDNLARTTKNLQALSMTLDSFTYGVLGQGGKESFGELAAKIIETSEKLTLVDLGQSTFSDTATMLILTALGSSPSVAKFNSVLLDRSLDMTQEESIPALADFLAASINLVQFCFEDNKGRDLIYDVKASEDGSYKVIVVDDVAGITEERETARTFELIEPEDLRQIRNKRLDKLVS